MKNFFAYVFIITTTVVLLSGCSLSPFKEAEKVNRNITPVVAAAHLQQDAIWAGVIIEVTPMENTTRLEILSYPLDGSDRPDTEQESNGRFFIQTDGVVKNKKFEAGNHVSVLGTIGSIMEINQDKVNIKIPVISSKQLYVWDPRTETQFYFGVGIFFHN